MIISFIIGVVFRILNVMFMFFPSLGDIANGFGAALATVFAYAMQWNWILPISDSLALVVRAIQFEFGILLFMFGKWVVEMIRGK